MEKKGQPLPSSLFPEPIKDSLWSLRGLEKGRKGGKKGGRRGEEGRKGGREREGGGELAAKRGEGKEMRNVKRRK